MNQLKPGLWRTQTTTDIHRTGQKPQKLKTSTAFVCVAPETRPAGLRLAIRLGCTGSVNIDGERGIWSFTEICAREPFSQGDGVVWGDFRRGYVIERDLMTADPANPAVARNVHEVVNGRWVRADCPKDAGK